MSSPANDTASIADRLDDALASGSTYTERQRTLALRDYLEAALLVREGEVITPAVALERANNVAQGLAGLLYGRLG